MAQAHSWEDLVLAGVDARRQHDTTQWDLGDLALLVEVKFGDHSLERYAGDIGVEYDTLKDYRMVARAFELGVRTPNLTWWHHRRVAGREDRLSWLKQAAEHGWSTRKLQDEVHLADNPPIPADLPAQIKLDIAQGGDPVKVATATVMQYGFLPPAMARSIARDTQTIVPGTDNKLHDGRSLEEEEIAVAEVARQGKLYDALKTLAEALDSPSNEASTIPDYMRPLVDPYLDQALDWLTQFETAWRARWQIKHSTPR